MWVKHQPWSSPSDGVDPEEVEWNLWRVRQQPFHQLAVRDRVLTVSGGGPGASVILGEVAVERLVREPYVGKPEAWRLLRLHFPALSDWTDEDFLGQDYSVDAPDEGWLLAWSGRRIREIGVARPSSWRFRPNGWLWIDEPSFGGPGAPEEPGRIADADLRRRVELHAMGRARRWLVEQGYGAADIEDTSATEPYDWWADSETLGEVIVEVKGTTGGLGRVTVTRNEVAAAAAGPELGYRAVLAVVHGIEVSLDAGEWAVRGGELHVVDPWRPWSLALEPATYTFDASPNPGGWTSGRKLPEELRPEAVAALSNQTLDLQDLAGAAERFVESAEFDRHVEQMKRSVLAAGDERCPTCSGPTVPIVWGLPTAEVAEAAERGEVVLGGCLLPSDAPADRRCPVCDQL